MHDNANGRTGVFHASQQRHRRGQFRMHSRGRTCSASSTTLASSSTSRSDGKGQGTSASSPCGPSLPPAPVPPDCCVSSTTPPLHIGRTLAPAPWPSRSQHARKKKHAWDRFLPLRRNMGLLCYEDQGY